MPSSDSDASDPTFEPSPSYSPSSPINTKPESSSQAQARIQKNQVHPHRPAASSPPARAISRSSPSRLLSSTASSPSRSPSQSSVALPNRQPSQQLSSQQSSVLHHPGPSTSSPTLRGLSSPQPQTIAEHSPFPHRPIGSQAQSKPRSISSRKSPSRPNRYTGPASTWRSWTEAERTIATSLDRVRAQDLAVHLYNAWILRRRAEIAGPANRNRSRSRSRSQSRSQSVPGSGTRSDIKVKGKAKAIESAEHDPSNTDPTQSNEITFLPPRLWTAWPLPPTEVPREQFLPTTLLGSHSAGTQIQGYRRPADPRPSAELEECLIAITTRFAKERWESRDWESETDNDSRSNSDSSSGKQPKVDQPSKKRKRRSTSVQGHRNVKFESDVDIQMNDSQASPQHPTAQTQTSPSSPSSSSSSSSSTSANTNTNTGGIKLFSSQVFTGPSPSSSSSSPSPSPSPSPSYSSPTPPARIPVFTADDDRIRQLLLPSTRHVISQLDQLLSALHRAQSGRKRKVVDVGGREAGEVLDMAELVFGKGVVKRARGRCGGILGV